MMERSRRTPRLLAFGTAVQLATTTLVWAVECNDNCDPDAGESTLTGNDCNDNGVDDAIDIVQQFSEDWAGATAVLAAERGWTSRPRIIVPMSEGGAS